VTQRFENFKRTHMMVQEHNKRGESYQMAIN
jgi:hypothetical protein